MKYIALLLVAATVQAVTECPITKVVAMLNDMKHKIVAEGDVENDQYNEFTEWAKKEISNKQYAIQTEKSQIDEISATAQELSADISKSSAEFESVSKQISVAESQLQEASDNRQNELADFKANDKELDDTIDSMVRAGEVLRRSGLSGSPGSAAKLKSAMVQVVNSLSVVMNAASISGTDRRRLHALIEASSASDDDDFQTPQPEAYKSHAASIIDTLADLKIKAESERSALRKAELESKHNFEMLKQSLEDQLTNLNKNSQSLQLNRNQKSEELGKAQGDLSSTQGALQEDSKYLKDIKAMVAEKSAAFDERKKARRVTS